MTRTYFGTDGVRGPYGGPVVNEEFAARLAWAAARWSRGAAGSSVRVLTGRDTRASGVSLEAAVARGLRAAGLEPVSLGMLPTPAVARAVRASGARLGVVITASHNPAADNGIKFFGSNGMKLTDRDESSIESFLGDPVSASDVRLATAVGAVADYIRVAQAILPAGALAGWRVVLDTANGATCGTSPVVLRGLGAEVIGLGDAPDGNNINAGVGSEHPQPLTVQSNLGVDAAIAAAGGRTLRASVGDRYVIERMKAEGATMGGESSGHIICADVSPTGDGLVAALKVIEVMLATGKPLSELRQVLKKFPQRTAALKVKEKKPLDGLTAVQAAVRALERELGARGRVLVRYSGTEAKLRLLVEGPTDAIVRDGIGRIEAAVRTELEVL
ncbi:MAG: phosphoglucosamine mutase [Verrucomicrobia bacterium]|nr:phosphoglucosamine mutase [Verrucomicrobiota bacterium]